MSVDHWAGEFAGEAEGRVVEEWDLCRSITGPVNSPAVVVEQIRQGVFACRSITGPVNSPAATGDDARRALRVSVDHWAGEFAGNRKQKSTLANYGVGRSLGR